MLHAASWPLGVLVSFKMMLVLIASMLSPASPNAVARCSRAGLARLGCGTRGANGRVGSPRNQRLFLRGGAPQPEKRTLAAAVQQDCDELSVSADTKGVHAGGAEEEAREGAGSTHAEILEEGLARFRGPKGGKVFYNRVMVVNRDLSVLMLRWFVAQRARESEDRRIRMLERIQNASASANSPGATGPRGAAGGNSTEVAASPVLDASCAAASEMAASTEPFKVLDAMSATGLRALRYALEVPEVDSITANDLDAHAVDAIRSNIELCKIPDGKIEAVQSDAVSLMLSRAGSGDLFDMIDLDPFGSPAALLSSALHALKPGGMLAVTATDLRVLCGNQPEVCFARYGAMSLKAPYSKEMAIRILLHAIRTAAAPLGRTVEPVVSVYMDFYVRVFVRVWPNRARALRSCLLAGSVFHCSGCNSYLLQPFAVETHRSRLAVARGPPPSLRGPRDWDRAKPLPTRTPTSTPSRLDDGGGAVPPEAAPSDAPEAARDGLCCDVGPFLVGGPIWLGALHDKAAVAQVRGLVNDTPSSIASRARLSGLLTLLELELPTPLFMSHAAMTKVLRCNPPKLSGLRAQIVAAGFNVSQAHVDAEGIKTDAPVALLWDLLRVWLRDHASANSVRRGEDLVASRLTSMDLQVLPEAAFNVSSPFFQRMRFDLPDPVVRRLYALNHAGAAADDAQPSGKDVDAAGVEDVGKHRAGNSGRKRARNAAGVPLFPQNPQANWGPKKSRGFRGRAGPTVQRPTTAAHLDNDVLPSGIDIPQESGHVQTWDQLSGHAADDTGRGTTQEQQDQAPENTVMWLRRMFKDKASSAGGFVLPAGAGGRGTPEPDEDAANEEAATL